MAAFFVRLEKLVDYAEKKIKIANTRMDSRWKRSSFGDWSKTGWKIFLIRGYLNELKKEFVEINFIEQPELIQILNQAKEINNGALFENLVAQELISKGFETFYYNSKKYGELDFVIELNGKVLPLEIKSGKDYKRHSALNNVLSIDEYAIEQAFVFSQRNIEVVDKRVYLPIYMIMFLKNDTLDNGIYKLDLSDLTIH